MDYADFIKKLGNEIKLQSANLMIATPAMSTKTHLQPDLLHIVYVEKGKGYCIVNNRKYSLTQGSIHIVFPNEPHMYTPEPSNPYTVYFLHITWLGEILELERIFKIRKNHVLPKLFKDITDLCWNVRSKTAEIRKTALLCDILAELADMSASETVEKQKIKTTALSDKKLASVLSLLSGPPFIFPGIDRLAASIGMSRRTFTNFFQQNTEMSAMDYFLRNRMIYAKNLMDSREFKLKEIAFQCGYNNPQNFLRAFKTYFKGE
jgi:AraC-like DNA-binding protein